MKNYSKKQIKSIAEAARLVVPKIDDWKRHCNALHYGMINGQQAKVFAKGVYRMGGFTIEKCAASNTVFVWLTCGETANVCVNVANGEILHVKGGMLASIYNRQN